MIQDQAEPPSASASRSTPLEAELSNVSTMDAEASFASISDPPEPAWLVEQLEQAPPPPDPAWDDPLFWGDEARERVVQEGPLHPSGQWHILQGWGPNWRRAIVRDTLTQHTVWGPEGAILIAWSHDGDEVAAIRENYTYNPALHRLVASHFQSEYGYVFERYAWPELHLLGSCPLQMPTGWPILLTLWPEQQVAVVQWRDQCESGLEFIHVSEASDHQLRNAGFPQVEAWWTLKKNLFPGGVALGVNRPTGPAFSPSGRCIAVGLPGDYDAQGHVITPVQAGTGRLGELLILDWQARALGRLAVKVQADTSDLFITPAYPFDVFRALMFLDEERLVLTLGNGTKQIFQFWPESTWMHPSQRPLDL